MVGSMARTLGIGRAIDIAVGSICEVSTHEPVFHLTFDDGPHPEVTPAVLEVLDEHQAPATFFLLVDPASRYPDLVRETVRRGHRIGLHGRTHLRLSTASSTEIRDEVSKAHRELEQIAAVQVDLFRPPYGAHGLRSLAATKAGGMTTVLWSVDTDDWKGLSPTSPLQGTTDRIGAGGIGLMHDTPVHGSVAEDSMANLIRKESLVRAMLEELRDRELKPVSFDELVAAGQPVRRAKVAR
jgi:peptidoglycan/xylan/chitin deacetylase (PgdA/CDA1 family)